MIARSVHAYGVHVAAPRARSSRRRIAIRQSATLAPSQAKTSERVLSDPTIQPDAKPRKFRLAVREVVLIVLGVLIALSLESVWQDRADRQSERALLAGLREEFVENAESLDRWIELHERIALAAEQFIAHLADVPQGRVTVVPDSIIGELGRTPTYDPELNSLDAALSSGQIALIRSAEIQRGLASWSRLLSDAKEEEQRAADQVYREFLPLLGELTEMGPAISWLVTDVRRVMRGASNGERPTTSSDVVVDRRLENALWVRYRLTSSAANELQILRTGLGELMALLESELD